MLPLRMAAIWRDALLTVPEGYDLTRED